jgi:AraC-like DNA-binding protein
LGREETSLVSDRHIILLNLQGNSEEGEYFLDGRRTSFKPRKPGAVLFVPAGCRWSGWEVGAATAGYLAISIDPAFVSDLYAASVSRTLSPLSPDLGFEDPVIMNAARAIGAEIPDRNPVSTMLVEGYAATLFAQLFRIQNYVPSVRTGGLAPVHLNRIISEIDEKLATDLSLAGLSSLIGVSIPHLCRAFRQTMGCSPHTFIIRRRLERAKDRLRHTTAPITEIALACGFSNPGHFSNSFRRETGMTPIAYRASWPIAASA